MQSTSLLEEVGRVSVPVVLKRGISSTLRELLASAETILEQGNQDVVLCECGIRTFESVSRTTLDLGAIMALKDRTHLPVMVDPTQCVTQAHRTRPLVQACREVGADGAILQVALNKSESKRYALRMEHLVEIMNGPPTANGE
jgi:3-deoxy-7-phosphoheptulonate synthase